MTLLLDTHVLLWWLAVKSAIGKLEITDDFLTDVQRGGFGELPFADVHANALRSLPRHHRDPFDRMLVAQAQLERLTLVSSDHRLAAYDVEVVAPG